MIYALIGENGAGKPTSMRTVMGLITIDEGEIELFGETGRREHDGFILKVHLPINHKLENYHKIDV
ncbi:MAG: bacitracin transporter ATP-binding protein [Neobacillus sp.]|jgi:ABC-type multidrug transport system ATPase subunit|nr:bacitracin transporter ATP-binding protein [Neobacillus sp.]